MSPRRRITRPGRDPVSVVSREVRRSGARRTHHENAHLLLGEEALEKLGERDSHRASSACVGREEGETGCAARRAHSRRVCPGINRTFGTF